MQGEVEGEARRGEISSCILHTSGQVVINVCRFISLELEFAFEKQKCVLYSGEVKKKKENKAQAIVLGQGWCLAAGTAPHLLHPWCPP